MKTANKDIVMLLRSVAAVYLLKGANKFRIIAYEKAADTIEGLNRELYDIWENGQLSNLEGIGPSIAGHLDEYFEDKDNCYLLKTINQLPVSIYVLMQVPGIGAKKAFKIVSNLGLNDPRTILDDVIAKGRQGKIAVIESFGDKSEQDIIEAVTLFKANLKRETRLPLGRALAIAADITDYLLLNKHVLTVSTLGSLRRGVATVGDIDLAACVDDGAHHEVIAHFLTYPGIVKIDNKGPEKASVFVTGSWRVDLRITNEDSHGAMLQYFTGSKAHNIKLREYAIKMGNSLSEYGIKQAQNSKHKAKNQGQKLKTFKTEKEFYNYLGLQYIPPEIREGTNEIELAKQNKVPTLVELSNIKGDFHLHSSYDIEPSHDLGTNTYSSILDQAQKMGYQYVGFADHNPSIGNHTEKEILTIMRNRFEHLRKLSTKYKRIQFIISCEVDILPDGQIAIPIKAVDYVEMLIVSVHSSFRKSRNEQTKRILKALSYPKVKILGHPTGRLIGRRDEINVDWPLVFRKCAARNIALEINAAVERLDLPDILARQAKGFGCSFVISTDAHHIDAMGQMKYGVIQARRGWLEKKDVINTQSYEAVRNWVAI